MNVKNDRVIQEMGGQIKLIFLLLFTHIVHEVV